MDIYPFKTLYIADLNALQAIENTGNSHLAILEEIQHTFPAVTIWIDAGINTESTVKIWQNKNVKIILASEAFTSIADYHLIAKQLNSAFVLSLDFLTQGYTGPIDLLTHSKHWPEELIIMTLAKVGANTGLDIPVIKQVMHRASQHRVYAAGGVRHSDDLRRLKALSVTGALMASALHSKQVTTKDLEALTI